MGYPLLPTQVILGAVLFAWLGICVIHDLRSRQVPTLLTVIPLLLAAAWRLFQGRWQLVLLTVALILLSDLLQAKWRIPLGCCAAIAGLSIPGSPDEVYAMLVIFAVWALWEIGATGGRTPRSSSPWFCCLPMGCCSFPSSWLAASRDWQP
jgi:hypothetical protein